MDSHRSDDRLLARLIQMLFNVLDIDHPDAKERQQGQILVVLAGISIGGALITLLFSLMGVMLWPGYVSVQASAVLGYLLAYLAGMGVVLLMVWSGRVSMAAFLWLGLTLITLFGVTLLDVHGRSQHVPGVLLHLIVIAALVRGPRGAWFMALTASLFELTFALAIVPDSRLDIVVISMTLNVMLAATMSFYLRLNSAATRQPPKRATIQLGAEYVSRGSHDANMLLNLILGYVHVISETDGANLSQSSRDALAEIQRNTHRIVDEMDELMDFIELERGTLPVNIHKADPSAVMYSLVGQLSDAAESRGLRLSCICDPNLPSTVEQDWLLLRHTLLRLIESTIVSMRGDGHVALRVHRHGPNLWLIHIQDTAQGFELPSGWRALENASGPRSRRDRIRRLAHTAAIAEMLGGTMEVHAEAKRGTTVLIGLPIRRP